MRSKDQIITKLRAIKPRFDRLHLRRIRLFGSVAAGTQHAGSDIDLLLDFDTPPSLFDLCEIKSDLEAELGAPVDTVQSDKLFPPLRDRILKEAIDI